MVYQLYREDITGKFTPDLTEQTLLTLVLLNHWVNGGNLWYQDRQVIYQIILSFIQVAFELDLCVAIGSETFTNLLLDEHAIERSMSYSLDSIGQNLIIFRYERSGSRFYLHVPYRVAEQFLPPELMLRTLQTRIQSYEDNKFNDQLMGVEDGLAYPIGSLLHSLLGDAYDEKIFPCGLSTEDEQEDYYSLHQKHHKGRIDYWPREEDYLYG